MPSVTESSTEEYLDPQIDLDNHPLPPIPSDSGGALKVEAKVLRYTHTNTHRHAHAHIDIYTPRAACSSPHNM